MRCALEFDGVSFGYRGIPLLRDVSLCVQPGQLLAVIGANGSGKTTLIRLGLGLVRPAAGSVRLFGTPVEAFGDWAKVGYVPQRAAANVTIPLSVREVVSTGLAGRLGLVRRPSHSEQAQVEQVMALLGVADVHDRAVTTLSGGQQQRVLIARALVTQPDLLVLDEPTTGVDVDARGVLRSTVEHLLDAGVAVIYISHDPEGFAGLADRVVEIRTGHVVDCEDPSAHRHAHVAARPARGHDRAEEPR